MPEFKEKWIKEGITDPEFIKFAEDEGKFLAKNKLSKNQFRNFYGSLKSIEMKGFKENKKEFYMLKPLLAYAYARQKSRGFERFKEIVDDCIDIIINADESVQEKYFKNFCKLTEALLAYHKAFGGN